MNPSAERSKWPVVLLVLIAVLILPHGLAAQVAPVSGSGGARGDYNLNQQAGVTGLRVPTQAQPEALGSFRTRYGPQVYARWDDFAG